MNYDPNKCRSCNWVVSHLRIMTFYGFYVQNKQPLYCRLSHAMKSRVRTGKEIEARLRRCLSQALESRRAYTSTEDEDAWCTTVVVCVWRPRQSHACTTLFFVRKMIRERVAAFLAENEDESEGENDRTNARNEGSFCCAPNNNHVEETLDPRCRITVPPTANNTQAKRRTQNQI